MTDLYAELSALLGGGKAQIEPKPTKHAKQSKRYSSLVRKRINGKDYYEPIYTHTEKREYEEYTARVRAGLFLVNKQYAEQAAKDALCGVCPKCHLILPFSGECECGYHK